MDNHDDPLPLDNEENENGFSRKCCLLSSKPSPGRQSLFGHSQVVGPLIRSWGSWSTDTSLCSCHAPAACVEVSLKFQLERYTCERATRSTSKGEEHNCCCKVAMGQVTPKLFGLQMGHLTMSALHMDLNLNMVQLTTNFQVCRQ